MLLSPAVMHDCYTVPAVDLPVLVLHGHELYVELAMAVLQGSRK